MATCREIFLTQAVSLTTFSQLFYASPKYFFRIPKTFQRLEHFFQNLELFSCHSFSFG